MQIIYRDTNYTLEKVLADIFMDHHHLTECSWAQQVPRWNRPYHSTIMYHTHSIVHIANGEKVGLRVCKSGLWGLLSSSNNYKFHFHPSEELTFEYWSLNVPGIIDE
jgi:hypothetical protein